MFARTWPSRGTRLKQRMQRALWKAVVIGDSPYGPENKVIRVDG